MAVVMVELTPAKEELHAAINEFNEKNELTKGCIGNDYAAGLSFGCKADGKIYCPPKGATPEEITRDIRSGKPLQEIWQEFKYKKGAVY